MRVTGGMYITALNSNSNILVRLHLEADKFCYYKCNPEPNKNYIMDIPELSQIITSNMNNNTCCNNEFIGKSNNIDKKNRVYDYIFLCFFLGNDFMPHFPALNIRTGGTDKMMNAYKATISNEVITDGKKINWKNVRKLVSFLAEKEEEYIQTEHQLRNKREKFFYPIKTEDELFKKWEVIPTFERENEKYINPLNSGWVQRYYKILFKTDYDEKRIKDICINFMEGLEWTMKYYTLGCPDWRWKYNYHYPPLLQDLIRFLPYFETEFIPNCIKNPVSPMVQLCYVVPKPSLTLLPKAIYDVLILNHDEWYTTDAEFIWAYCRYFWESHVDLPEIDINILENFIRSNSYLLK
jgi:5'-3' exonuclease